MERKILVAVDGSTYSYNSLRYLSELFTDLKEIYIHLLYVVPTGSLPLGMEWLCDQDRILSLSPAERRRYYSAKRFMQEAVLQLGRRGIVAEQVSTQIMLAKAGVAADIIYEAHSGLYDALLIGRRGLTKIEELILGSVSDAVARDCYSMPVWVVDGKVKVPEDSDIPFPKYPFAVPSALSQFELIRVSLVDPGTKLADILHWSASVIPAGAAAHVRPPVFPD